MVLEFLGGSFDSWVVGFFMLLSGLIGYIAADMYQLHKLRTTGKFVSRRGIYTFTPKEKTANE